MNAEGTNRLAGHVKGFRGAVCTGIGFGAMANCGERTSPAVARGYHELTWGVILQFAKSEPLVLTWDEDARVGDPFFLDYTSLKELSAIDSLELQDVSAFPPWNAYVGNMLLNFGVLTYETNYPGDTEGAWRAMPWGLELIFHFGSLLVGAMQHGHFMDDVLCADEIVVVHDPALIERLKVSRSGERGEWTTWTNPAV
jgi:hypothetical protein